MYKKKSLKYIAINLMLIFIFQIVTPTVSFALTGGPSQPETTAFTPVGSNELVDLSTGDFSYNIPLMTIPGPNGGYPINMGYKGGVSMEQEASWVGLGWDLNVGAINRNLRGLPDDFYGDIVTKKMSIKPDITKSISYTINLVGLLGKKLSLWGFELGKSKISMSRNNYRGFGFGLGQSFGIGDCSLGLDYQSSDGLSLNVGYEFGITSTSFLGLSASFGTAQGLNSIGLDLKKSYEYCSKTKSSNDIASTKSISAGASFAKLAPVGEIRMERTTKTNFLGLGSGKVEVLGKYKELVSGNISKTISTITNKTRNIGAYGYIYSEFALKDKLKDFHIENQQIDYEYSPVTELPVLDNDIFSISGQGIGGSFRAYRSDIPMLSPTSKKSTISTLGGSAELGLGTGFIHGAVTVVTGRNEGHYYGGWGAAGDNGGIDKLNSIGYSGETTSKPLYKPFYFDYLGKQTKSDQQTFNNILGNKAVRFPIKLSGKKKIQKIKSKFGEIKSSTSIKTNIAAPRKISTNHIAYRTKGEIKADITINNNDYKYYFDESTSSYQGFDISNTSRGSDNHINEISVVNTEGSKYTYGLPAYNTHKEDVSFASGKESNYSKRKVSYSSRDISLGNQQGLDNYYNSVTIRDYAYAYLLTSTSSVDYVDVTNNGFSDDDLGYWCKFSYTTNKDYKWRAPFSGANFIPGNYSDKPGKHDDKGSFTYGKKDLHYLHAIETKSHIAIFEVGDRNDNRGAFSRGQLNGTIGDTSKYLKSIKLYSKNDPLYNSNDESSLTSMTPIKTVILKYDYSQCPGIENYGQVTSDPNHIITSGSTTKTSLGKSSGKLTLRQIYFTHQNNNKGELTPYNFWYGNEKSSNHNNPSYTYANNIDRWGNYQSNIPFGSNSNQYPYTNQLVKKYFLADRNKDVAAWNMTSIELPSGGDIEVEYESDDYGYIQDVKAGQMFKVERIGRKSIANGDYGQFDYGTSRKPDIANYIHFSGVSNNSQVKDCINGLTYIFFKVYVNLKKKSGKMKKEYVQGYAEIDKNGNYYGINGSTGYVKIKNVKYGKKDKKIIHPFQKAAIQHLYSRVDLQGKVANPIRQLRVLIQGPIHVFKNKKNWCRELALNSAPASLIRLNSPSKSKVGEEHRVKYGGGHRVKSVKINTGWGETYGQKYSYINEDGLTSGVATYEPITGGEENSMKVPENYDGILDRSSLKGKTQYFAEKPYCEAFYPAAVVFYGRVITMPLEPEDKGIIGFTLNKQNQAGISINEYYTSKDFPVFEDNTGKWSEGREFKVSFPIPYTGDFPKQKTSAYSQGFIIELNDMAGKMKSFSTYKYQSDVSNIKNVDAKTQVKYIYHTDKNYPKKLSGKVTILNQDGVFEKDKTIGKKVEFYVYNAESTMINHQRSDIANVESTVPGIPIPLYILIRNRGINQKRTIVTTKIISRTGILKEVITDDNGRKTVSKNLAFDTQTGEALIQTQENDFDKPIYSYNYAGHWKYPALAGKYKNYRAKFEINGSSSSTSYSISNVTKASDILVVGDEIVNANGKKAYVTSVGNSNYFEAKSMDNSPVFCTSSSKEVVTIMNSGYRNMQSVKVGNIVSLSNPLNWNFAKNLIVEDVANKIATGTLGIVNQFITPCDTFIYKNPVLSIIPKKDCPDCTSYSKMLEFDVEGFGCKVNILLANTYKYNSFSISTVGQAINILNTPVILGSAINFHDVVNPSSVNKISEIEWNYLGDGYFVNISTDCNLSCPIKDVLHATATELEDGWQYNYSDAGIGNVIGYDNSQGGYNPYYYGQKNNWKGKRSWVHQIDRKQEGQDMPLATTSSTMSPSEMKINKDGTYKIFRFFSWSLPLVQNEKINWSWTSEMTKYSPFGYDLENVNPLGIYSSELYGYDNSLVTAVGANAPYNEIAFDGFEESPIGYKALSTSFGHFNWLSYNANSNKITDEESHTGNQSLKLKNGSIKINLTNTNNFTPKINKKYIISAWVKKGGKDANPQLNLFNTTTTTSSSHAVLNFGINGKYIGKEIDGWQKVELTFTLTGSISDYVLSMETNSRLTPIPMTGFNGTSYFDDVRISPFDGAMKSYVYDPISLKLVAVLDNLNYATFYNYDEEGKLVQTKVETPEGVTTISTKKDNIAH